MAEFSNWPRTRLGDVARVVRGISYKSSEINSDGIGRPFLTLKNAGRGGGYRPEGLKYFTGRVKPDQTVRTGELLIANTDLTRDKAILGCPILLPTLKSFNVACFSLDLARLIPDPSLLSPQFLALVLQSEASRNFMKVHSSGTTVIHLKMSDVPDLPVPIPPPAAQRRIVDLVQSLDTYLDGLSQELAALVSFENATLATVFGAPVRSDGERLDSVASVTDCEHRTAPGSLGSPFGYSIGTGDLNFGVIELSSAKPVDKDTWLEWSRRVEVQAGDIIMSREAPVGGVGFVRGDVPLCLGQRTVLVRCGDTVASAYLAAYLRCPLTQAWMTELSVGLTVAHLNVADIRALPLPELPSSLIQEQIGAVFDSFIESRRAFERELAATNVLRSTLISSFMSGSMTFAPSYDSLIDEIA